MCVFFLSVIFIKANLLKFSLASDNTSSQVIIGVLLAWWVYSLELILATIVSVVFRLLTQSSLNPHEILFKNIVLKIFLMTIITITGLSYFINVISGHTCQKFLIEKQTQILFGLTPVFYMFIIGSSTHTGKRFYNDFGMLIQMKK